jgi:fatty-acyl-CoA synthase
LWQIRIPPDWNRTRPIIVPLSPLSFLERSAFRLSEANFDHPGRSPIHLEGKLRPLPPAGFRTENRGIGKGDTVAVMLPNSAPMFECHFGVPMTGAVLNTLNTRLDAEAIAFMLQHGEAKVLITDPEFPPHQGCAGTDRGPEAAGHRHHRPGIYRRRSAGEKDYEAFLSEGEPDFAWQLPENEWDAISLNYTSGTTGNPKGVVYHHRGAYLNSASNIISWGMPPHSVYLWTLPMFHCNGWCFPWTLAANAGTSVCLRKVDPALIFGLIKAHKVSHMCGAPIVYGMMINAPAALKEGIEHQVNGLIAGAAPPAAIIEGAEQMGFNITHVYENSRRPVKRVVDYNVKVRVKATARVSIWPTSR